VKTLESLQLHAKAASKPLLDLLMSKNPELRAAAASALGRVRAPADDVIPGLIICLMDPSPDVVTASAEVLGRFQDGAAAAVPGLVACLTSKVQPANTKCAAAVALGHIRNPGRIHLGEADSCDAITALVDSLAHEEASVRAAAASALGNLHPHAASGANKLTQCLQDSDSTVRESAVKAMGRLEQFATKSVPVLCKKSLKDTVDEVRLAAVEALSYLREMRHLGPYSGLVDAAVREREKDCNRRVSQAAKAFTKNTGLKWCTVNKKFMNCHHTVCRKDVVCEMQECAESDRDNADSQPVNGCNSRTECRRYRIAPKDRKLEKFWV